VEKNLARDVPNKRYAAIAILRVLVVVLTLMLFGTKVKFAREYS